MNRRRADGDRHSSLSALMLYRAFPATPCSFLRQGLRRARKRRPAPILRIRKSSLPPVLPPLFLPEIPMRPHFPGALSEKRCTLAHRASEKSSVDGTHRRKRGIFAFFPEEPSLVDGNAEQVRLSALPGNTGRSSSARQTVRPSHAPEKHASGTTRRGTSPPETRTAPACPEWPTSPWP